MTTIHRSTEYKILTNPATLRKIADKMERRFPEMRLGESTFIDVLGYVNGDMVCIYADQQAMSKP